MNIEITGETEELIRAAIAAGQYASAEDFIAEMASKWRREEQSKDTTMPVMPKRVDLDTLLVDQRIHPCDNPERLKTPIWPEGESTDDFLAFLKETRHDRSNVPEQL